MRSNTSRRARQFGAGLAPNSWKRVTAPRNATPVTANATGVGSKLGIGNTPATWKMFVAHGITDPTSRAALCPRNSSALLRIRATSGTNPSTPRRYVYAATTQYHGPPRLSSKTRSPYATAVVST
jgi:hypothetical protein